MYKESIDQYWMYDVAKMIAMINGNDDTMACDATLGLCKKYASIGFRWTLNHFKFPSTMAVALFIVFSSSLSECV